jgi:hypothetical protein
MRALAGHAGERPHIASAVELTARLASGGGGLLKVEATEQNGRHGRGRNEQGELLPQQQATQ